MEQVKILYCKWCPREQECDDHLNQEEKMGCLACGGFANELKTIPEILIKDLDQSLPDHEIFEGDNIVRFTIDVAQQHMLKENWVKVLPKEEK